MKQTLRWQYWTVLGVSIFFFLLATRAPHIVQMAAIIVGCSGFWYWLREMQD